MIQRFQENEVNRLLKGFPAVGILGARQVGKTTLAMQLAKKLNRRVLHLDLESLRDQERLGKDPHLFFEQFENHCVILDEIQRRPDLFPVLRPVIDQNRTPGRFLILGSASPHLLAKSTESLAGRIAYVELFPLHLDEIGSSKETLLTHWFKGGFPEAYFASHTDFWSDWHKNFLRSYVDVDLPALGIKTQSGAIAQLLKVLASVQGGLYHVEGLSRSLGLRTALIRDYLDLLEKSYMIRRLLPYYSNVGKRMTRSPKLYIRDSGVLHYLNNLPDQSYLHQHYVKGSSWEGYVIEHIINQLKDNVFPFFYQTSNQAEIDLVLEVANQVVACFEIKLSDSPALTKGNHFAVEDMRCENNFVLTYSAGDYKLNAKWHVTDLYHVGQHLDRLGLRASYFVGK